jgi:thiamine-monophosphate kinase
MSGPSEFELIARFVQAFAGARGEVVLGPGDDAALLRPRRGEELAMTVDALVEGVHFTRAFTPAEIGHKALAVNLSDLAAMGARPVAFLCALALPVSQRSRLRGIAQGMAALARQSGCVLAGGNFTRARELSLTITAIGAAPRGRALRRTGARPGDLLVVSGELGGAAAALRRPRDRGLRARQRLPIPRLELGLAARGLASAAIDVSDGLLQDLSHLLDASGVGAALHPEAIPVAMGATVEEALSGGEDYELLLAISERALPRLLGRARRLGIPLTLIGEVTRAPGLRGLSVKPPPGHDHFSRSAH